MKAKSGNGADAAGAGVVADGVDATPDPKRKPGRPKGLPKTGGRKKGTPSAMGKAAREYLAQHSGYLDILCRVCAGKSIKMSGPTGKPTWFYPTWEDRRWALEIAVSKLLPTMAASEISGPDQEPLLPQHTDREWARRIAFVLRRGDTEGRSEAQATEGSAGDRPSSGRSGDGGAASGSSLSAPVSASSPSRHGNAGNSADAPPRGRFSGRSGSGLPQQAQSKSDDSPEHFSENFKAKKPKPPAEPQVGQDAYIGQFVVKCREPQRPGLPLSYRIYAANGALLSGSCAGWQGALRWIRHRDPDSDLTPEIRSAVADDWGDPIPRDQRETPAPRSQVRRDYMNRKR